MPSRFWSAGGNRALSPARGFSGNLDPSSGYALYLPFSAASPTYRSGSTTSASPPEICGDPTMAGSGWWTLDPGVTISGGKMNWVAVAAGGAYHTLVLNIGASYTATYTMMRFTET